MKQRGDTLIEVMIAIAIIGSVIAISYATASKALQVGRSAQERTEALKLVEGQIEILKANASVSDQVYRVVTANASFCLDSSGVKYDQGAIQDDLFSDQLISSSTDTVLAGQTYHKNCSVGTESRYKLSIVRTDTGTDLALRNLFTVRARWERIGGGKDEVKVLYRLHERLFR